MSSFTAKKNVRTYSRQKKRSFHDEEPPTKRRRVETTGAIAVNETVVPRPNSPIARSSHPIRDSSTPPLSSDKSSPAVFSDEPVRSSPPSSPAPQSSPPLLQKRRPVFSLFQKSVKSNNIVKQPFAERSHNIQDPPREQSKKKRMVQMQLDLAGEHRKQCKTCGMEYIPSSAEDAALHKKFHTMNCGGVDFTKPIIERLRKTNVWSGGDGAFIGVVGRKDALALRHRASEVLRVVNTELAAVPIEEEELWGQAGRTVFADAPIEEAHASKSQPPLADTATQPLVDRFKMYLYIRGNKCVGACLVERIWEAYAVLGQNDTSEPSCQLPGTVQSSSISISATPDSAVLGISRVWTSSEHRKAGIATRLLESARSDFLYGLMVEKEQIAFSQPTESGQNLARKWFRQESGWHVYIDR
ncbi:hypothetical protein ACN47E_001384 [Coniothyrium glycines]